MALQITGQVSPNQKRNRTMKRSDNEAANMAMAQVKCNAERRRLGMDIGEYADYAMARFKRELDARLAEYEKEGQAQ